jgi:hypothetical protein
MFEQSMTLKAYNRGLVRDVIHDVTDGRRRHVGGIFFAPRGKFYWKQR